MSTIDWTLLGISVITGAFIIVAAALLWYVAKAAMRLAQWIRG